MDETEPTEPKSGRESILIAEDGEAVRKLGRRILERAGYTVLEAPSGEEALRIAETCDEPIHPWRPQPEQPEHPGRNEKGPRH